MVQTPEQMLLEVWKIPRRVDSAAVTVDQICRAANQMGDTAEKKLRWALGFAAQDLTELTAGDWVNLKLQLAAFSTPIRRVLQETAVTEQLPVDSNAFPTKKEVEKIHNTFDTLLQTFQSEHSVSFAYQGKISFNLLQGRDGKYSLGYGVSDYVVRCMIALARLLGELGERVQTCPAKKDGCGKRFVASRTDQQYCSTTCVSRATTRRRRALLQKKRGR
jgi:hypothetical protein